MYEIMDESSKSSLDDVRIHGLSKTVSCVSMDSDNNSNHNRNHTIRHSSSLMDEELLLGYRNNDVLKTSTSFSGYHGYSSKRRGHGWRPLSMAEPGTPGFTMMSAYGQSNRSVPPPLPSNPPPMAGSYSDMSDIDSSVSLHTADKRVPEIEYLTEPDITEQPKEQGHQSHGQRRLKSLGRFFSFKRSNKKVNHKPPFCDINARDITMSDEDRIRLLIMVKEGRVSMDEAINTVKRYEKEKKTGVHKNLNDYIPEETVKIPVATDKNPRLSSPLKFLRSFSFTKGSKRKKFLRDLDFYYKEQEKRQKSVQERIATVTIEDGNYSQPVCCTNKQCGTERKKCHTCSHGNGNHRRTASNHTSGTCVDEHSNRRQYLKTQSYEPQEFQSAHRMGLNQYPGGYHSPYHSGYAGRQEANYPDPRDSTHVCSQCNQSSLSRRHYHRSNTQPTMPQHSPYFQRDLTRHSFHSMPYRNHDHEIGPYMPHMPYSNSFSNGPNYGYEQQGYPVMPRSYGSSHAPYYQPGVVPHTILEERSPCVSTRSSMDNLHMHSPVHIPGHTHATLHRHVTNPCFDDVSNNNPSCRKHEQHYTNGVNITRQSHNRPNTHNVPNQNSHNVPNQNSHNVPNQNSHNVPNQNSDCNMNTAATNSTRAAERPQRQLPQLPIGDSGGITAEDEENANTGELSTSSVTTESGCGTSIRSSLQENYAQTCSLGRNPATPESVEQLCEKLGIQHLLDVFLNNGFETLELFKQLEEEDLSALGVTQATDKAKILTAVTLLPDEDYDGFSYTYRPVSDIYSVVNKPRLDQASNNNQPTQPTNTTVAEICVNPVLLQHVTTAEICDNPVLQEQNTTTAEILSNLGLQARDSGCYVGVDNSTVNTNAHATSVAS